MYISMQKQTVDKNTLSVHNGKSKLVC